jgi:hypothetical protein
MEVRNSLNLSENIKANIVEVTLMPYDNTKMKLDVTYEKFSWVQMTCDSSQ